MHDVDTSLLVATGNSGKRREFETLLGPLLGDSWKVFDRKTWPDPLPEVIEDAETFTGNAIKKALEPARQTGACVLSDDSGLVVDALGGRPGVYSARYAGPNATDEDNNRLLVRELAGVPFEKRSARYVAVICLVLINNTIGRALLSRRGLTFADIPVHDSPGEGELVRCGDEAMVFFEGTVEGKIIDEACGAGGFGYDPYFLVEAWGKTMAEVPLSQKNTISHRARASDKLLEFFRSEVEGI
ncbi:MAG: non-canonical purine NTP pyrophosphatase [Bradymonadaceae bacterium]